jgi:DNA anti-recombination protein RmuC
VVRALSASVQRLTVNFSVHIPTVLIVLVLLAGAVAVGLAGWLAARGAAARARLAVELEAERRAATEKLAILQDAEAKLREAFAALSSEALRHNNQSFLELAKTSLTEFQQAAKVDLDGRQKAIEDLVQPLKTSLVQVDTKLQEVERNRVGTQAALTEQLRVGGSPA